MVERKADAGTDVQEKKLFARAPVPAFSSCNSFLEMLYSATEALKPFRRWRKNIYDRTFI